VVTLHRWATTHSWEFRFAGFPSKYLIQRGKSNSGEPSLAKFHSKCPASGWRKPGQNSWDFLRGRGVTKRFLCVEGPI
jgi:hypothetical protein